MGLDGGIRNNPVAMITIAVVLLAVSAVILFTRSGGPTTQTGRWFYDLDAGELYVAQEAMPPFTAPSGGEGVVAMVYACGHCTDENRRIGYLERYTEQGLKWMRDPPLDEDGGTNPGHMIGVFKDDGELTWVQADSPQGFMVTERLSPQLCNGWQMCQP